VPGQPWSEKDNRVQMNFSGDISSMTPDQYDVALTLRQAQHIINVAHYSEACGEQVGRPMGVVTLAEGAWILRSYTEAVEALGHGLRDLRRGLADASDIFPLQKRVIHLGMALYSVAA
jgi:hypothetical protein